MTVGLGVGPRGLAGLAVARVDLVDLERASRSAARLGRLRRLTAVGMVEWAAGACDRADKEATIRDQARDVKPAASPLPPAPAALVARSPARHCRRGRCCAASGINPCPRSCSTPRAERRADR